MGRKVQHDNLKKTTTRFRENTLTTQCHPQNNGQHTTVTDQKRTTILLLWAPNKPQSIYTFLFINHEVLSG